MFLKIGTRFINTDAVTTIFDDGDSLTVYFNVTNDGDAARISFRDDEKTAMLRWLNENSVDIMATQPEPVETPLPKFNRDDKVQIWEPLEGEREYYGAIGSITDMHFNEDERFIYQVELEKFSTTVHMYERQLKLADTIPF